jgi:hypothetical protein
MNGVNFVYTRIFYQHYFLLSDKDLLYVITKYYLNAKLATLLLSLLITDKFILESYIYIYIYIISVQPFVEVRRLIYLIRKWFRKMTKEQIR